MTIYFIICSVVFASTYVGVELFRRWSLKRELLDVPNERSSHVLPTPRGGGLIIFLITITAFLIYSLEPSRTVYLAAWLAAVVVALISLLDDVRDISPFARFIVHCVAAGLVVFALGGFDKVLVPYYGIIYLGLPGKILAFLWIIWMINAYNFMDGIDGIAGLQAVTAGIGWCAAALILNISDVFFFGAVIVCAAVGFLIHNWQPAKIFMGDVGSAFLGLVFAIMPLIAAREIQSAEIAALTPWFGLLFVWFFVFDTVLTFIKRLLRGEKVWQAHREHIYQKLVISGYQHYLVTLFYGAISAALAGALLLGLKYSMNFDSVMLTAVVCTTLMLLTFWRWSERKVAGRIQNNSL